MTQSKRFTGTFNPMNDEAFKGVIYVRKADLPGGLRSNVDAIVSRIDPESLAMGWVEVSGWGSCKLVARKSGATMRYGLQHYGYYDCCRKATVELLGHATYGLSRRSMPNWAGLKLDELVRFMYGENCGKPVKVMSWTRTGAASMRVALMDRGGLTWEISFTKGERKLDQVHWRLINSPIGRVSVNDLLGAA